MRFWLSCDENCNKFSESLVIRGWCGFSGGSRRWLSMGSGMAGGWNESSNFLPGCRDWPWRGMLTAGLEYRIV